LELGHISRRKRRKEKKAASGLDIGRISIFPLPAYPRPKKNVAPALAACSFAHMVRSLVVAKLQEDIDAVTNETRYGSGRVRT
jgi:hypothetical protein